MALTAAEKNQIATSATTASQLAIVEGFGLGLGGASFIGLAFLPLVLGLAAQFNRARFPKLSIGDIGSAAAAARQGSLISADPFFGDVVISQPDQTEFLTELVRNAAIRRVAADQDSSRLFLQRRAVIEGLEESAEERGFARAVDPSLRGGVFRANPEAPLQFIEGDFLA